jgi:hypothetical protein
MTFLRSGICIKINILHGHDILKMYDDIKISEFPENHILLHNTDRQLVYM